MDQEHKQDEVPLPVESVMGGKFQIREKIGNGSFGNIFRGYDKDTNEAVAIKIGQQTPGNATLAKEARILAELSEGFGFPKLMYYGKEGSQSIMVMNLLGPDLERLFVAVNSRYTMKTVLMLADQFLTRIEYLHSKGYVHRDIKPENFVLGVGQTLKNIYLIDFGLAKQWREPSGRHIEYRESKGLVGTARYASIAAQNGVEQSRRDDLESIGYVLIYFLKGVLPWQNLKCDSDTDKYSKICDVKMATTIPQLCEGLPKIFEEYLTNVRNLQFSEAPNYKYLKKLFRKYFLEHGYDYDYKYDWMKGGSRSSYQNMNHEEAHVETRPNQQQPKVKSHTLMLDGLGERKPSPEGMQIADALIVSTGDQKVSTRMMAGRGMTGKEGDNKEFFGNAQVKSSVNDNKVTPWTIQVVDTRGRHTIQVAAEVNNNTDPSKAQRMSDLGDDDIPNESSNIEKKVSFKGQFLEDVRRQLSFPSGNIVIRKYLGTSTLTRGDVVLASRKSDSPVDSPARARGAQKGISMIIRYDYADDESIEVIVDPAISLSEHISENELSAVYSTYQKNGVYSYFNSLLV